MYNRNHYFGLGPIPETDTKTTFQRIIFNHKGPLKPNFLANIEEFKIIFEDPCFNFKFLKTQTLLRSRKTWENLKKWVLVLEKKNSALIPIPKLDLGFWFPIPKLNFGLTLGQYNVMMHQCAQPLHYLAWLWSRFCFWGRS